MMQRLLKSCAITCVDQITSKYLGRRFTLKEINARASGKDVEDREGAGRRGHQAVVLTGSPVSGLFILGSPFAF